MKTALIYLLQVTACSGILYGYYHIFLRNKKFHQYNRYYLLLSVVLSIVVPFLHIPVYVESGSATPLFVKTLTVFETAPFESGTVHQQPESRQSMDWKITASLIYLLAALILFVRFAAGIIRIMRMTRIYPAEKIDNIRFVRTNDPSTPFSFFNWLFWNNQVELNSDSGQQILRHEIFHIRQKHSWDIIFLEVMTICLWLNPFLHLIKKEVKAIHEFLADKHAVNENREWDYAELLLMHVLGSPNMRLTHPFFQNQIKRRIAMLTNSKKPGYQYLRKIMVLPLAAIVTVLFAFTFKNKNNQPYAGTGDNITIMVDAGHGGDDPGAIIPGKKITEATLSLEIAKAIQDAAKEFNVNVVLTRDDHGFPGNAANKDEALKKRIEMSKRVRPAAFISLHLGTSQDLTQNAYSGFEAYISRNNDSHSDRLAMAVLQSLAPLYKTRENAAIRTGQGIYVLDRNSSPSILLQCGFINNPADLAFISQKANQEKIARRILEGIVKFSSQKKEQVSIQDGQYRITMQADTFFVHTNNKRDQKSLIIINGKEHDPALLDGKAIISGEVQAFGKNDEEAIRRYGVKAVNGLLVFDNAKIVDGSRPEFIHSSRQLNDTIPTDKVFTKSEIEPAFPGGETGWTRFLEKNMNRSVAADNGAPHGKYTVVLQFIVNTDGTITEITSLTQHGYGMEKEAIRLIGTGPKWIPALQNGIKVRAYKKQLFHFTVGSDQDLVERDIKPPLKEVVVQGYPATSVTPSKKITAVEQPKNEPVVVEEAVVPGRPSKIREVPVTVSAPGKKLRNAQGKPLIIEEAVIVEQPANLVETEEVTVTGQPAKKTGPSKVKVPGKPSVKPAIKEKKLEKEN